MKAICIIAATILITQSVTAQVQPPTPGNLMQPNTAVNLLGTAHLPKAKLIGLSATGNIYAMPQDNMPCLVPNLSLQNSMPVYSTQLVNANMPNSILKHDYFGASSDKNIFFNPVKITSEPSKNLMLDLIRK